MRNDVENSVREPIWANIIFFAVTILTAVIGVPLYLSRHTLSLSDWSLFAFYMAVTGLSITVGYHRLFSHRTFRASPLVEFFVLFFGAAAFEQSALRWSSQHRDHHRYVDTDKDPYSIKKGFFYAHIGWMMFWRHPCHFENARDLQRNKMLMHQHQHYHLWAFGAGIVLPLLIGAAIGNMWAALFFTVCLRITLVYHSTFCINSVCHMFGKATYDIYSSAKDHWFVALMTYGEGYHNFHHRFPGDYRNAVRWYQWDPSKWIIFMLKKAGLARDLKKVSDFRILEAKLAAENQRAADWILERCAQQARFAALQHGLNQHYLNLKHLLFTWEGALKNYHTLLRDQFNAASLEIRQGAHFQLIQAKNQFDQARRQWQSFHVNQLGLIPS